LHVEHLIEDHGGIVLFAGRDEEGVLVSFASDHHAARIVVERLELGETVAVQVGEWQLLGRIPERETIDNVVESFARDLATLPTADRGAPT
jgi:hypothetical protein